MKGSTGTPGSLVSNKATWKAFRQKVNSAKGRIANANSHSALKSQSMAGKIIAVNPAKCVHALERFGSCKLS